MTQPTPTAPAGPPAGAPAQAAGAPTGDPQQVAPPAQLPAQQGQQQPAQPQQPWQPPQPQYAPGAPAQPPAWQPQYQQPALYQPVIPLPTATPQTGDPGGDGESELSKLPQWAQKQITDLRAESAKRRVEARSATVNQHAWAAAQQLGANAPAVLGSLAWQQVAAQLDPTSPDFARHLSEAVHQVMTANPWMAAAPQPQPGQAPGMQQGQPGMPPTPAPPMPGQPPAPPMPGYQPYPGQPYGYGAYPPPQPPAPPAPSGADFSGTSTSTGPINEAQLAQMTPAQIAQAYENGQLKHLL